ncbi:hypothetical protein [Peribacillus frigoritolerans]|uniref:hypothetical protein n=1 Tax=Peribacillus frigoritolerans TaxID=450367 RepID=UPI0021AAEA43|nr:hypothetical protein [Peribacillus frigoritolerans]
MKAWWPPSVTADIQVRYVIPSIAVCVQMQIDVGKLIIEGKVQREDGWGTLRYFQNKKTDPNGSVFFISL